ncbi:hypothetical protein FHW96_002849 [Novosphingobium sp. SG751A]|uniref:sce7726 family protein n=1 Tax=Novosphingobium sp. SG751A TaxID=2587000 RepID=UPI001554FF64|nr:sce7726 family protein [Novosphingobium sp. SG751A]NOW46689.1 hypothetical protein [Novosphingobium sp. SG751A]
MDEASAKAQVLSHIRRSARSALPLVTAEFSLGKSGVRADLVLLAENELIGIEIKTERDTLRRLPTQIAGYSRYFDYTVVVVAECHLPGLAAIDLCGASVWAFSNNGIRTISNGHRNSVLPSAWLELLPLQERRRVVASEVPLRDHVCQVFTNRYSKISARFWAEISGRTITARHMPLLSRFSERREAERQISLQREACWDKWHDAIAAFA